MTGGTLDDRVVLVTGAASGLGLASSRLAHQRGAKLVLADINVDALEPIAAELGALAIACDVSDPTDSARAVEATVSHHGRIDGLVNAAGVMQTSPYLEIDEAQYDRIVSVNLKGAFFLAQAAARRMTAGGGSIVLFSSTAGRAGRPLASHYAAAKAGILNLVKSTAVALGPNNVRVNAVCPGLIETPMIAHIRDERSRLQSVTAADVQARWESSIPLQRLGTPEDVAEVIAFLLSEASRYITGEQIGVVGGTDGS